MGWGRPRVLYITGLNEAAAQGSLGPPCRLMRKVLDSPSSEPRGGGCAEREESPEPVWGEAGSGRQQPPGSANRLEPGWQSEVNPIWTERVGGG
jgi:hypothetical protein